MDIQEIKIIVSNVDGILTDGTVYRDELSNPVFKKYNMLDFEAINEIKKNYVFVFISSDNAINYNLFRNKNIPFYWAKRSKKYILYELLNRYELSPTELLYIGSTYSDEESMMLSQVSICTEVSPLRIRNIADIIINKSGGDGVLSYVYDYILSPNLK